MFIHLEQIGITPGRKTQYNAGKYICYIMIHLFKFKYCGISTDSAKHMVLYKDFNISQI